jgi:hypothetical protein
MSSISSVGGSAAAYQALQAAASADKPTVKTPASSVPATPIKTSDGDADDGGGGRLNITA